MTFSTTVPYLTGTVFTPLKKNSNIPQMNCKKAIWVNSIGMNVPCGQCMHCRVNKGRKWSSRIIMEWLFCPYQCYFLTFTIAPEHRNANKSLDKKKFLRWLENAQIALGSFRYYAVGEYGDESFREHYHLAVFPKHPAQVPALKTRWKKGHVSASPLNHARARYLAHYTGKKLTKTRDPRLKSGQEPEFRSSSRNPPLGNAFCEAIIKKYSSGQAQIELVKRGDITRSFRIDGKLYPIGDWALKKIRTALGIPLTHTGRCANNPNYETYYPLEEAEWDPEQAINLEKQLNAKIKQRRLRGESPKI